MRGFPWLMTGNLRGLGMREVLPSFSDCAGNASRAQPSCPTVSLQPRAQHVPRSPRNKGTSCCHGVPAAPHETPARVAATLHVTPARVYQACPAARFQGLSLVN